MRIGSARAAGRLARLRPTRRRRRSLRRRGSLRLVVAARNPDSVGRTLVRLPVTVRRAAKRKRRR